jgi:hypothetical protein
MRASSVRLARDKHWPGFVGTLPLSLAESESGATRSQVLEYKFDLDGLISDFAKEVKFQNEINGIVCWKVGDSYQENFSVRSYLIGEEGNGRQLYGATHSLWHERMKLADIICVSDLLRFVSDPETVKADHSTRFRG